MHLAQFKAMLSMLSLSVAVNTLMFPDKNEGHQHIKTIDKLHESFADTIG